MSLGSPSCIWATYHLGIAMAPLRRLALSVPFTIATTSYQTTCTVSERSSIKGTRQCKPTRCRLPSITTLLPFVYWKMGTYQNVTPGSKPQTVQCWQHSKIEREPALTSCYGLLATLLSCIFQKNSILLESATIDYSALKWLALVGA